MPHYRIHLEYDGLDFHGWQIQPGRRTVQETLTEVLTRLDAGVRVRVEGAGRTDAGVHALGQVASFALQRDWTPERLRRAMNSHLPADVHVHAVMQASPEFSARASALWRRYRYQMLRRPSPAGRRTHHVLLWPVDPEPMQRAAAHLVGEHDFSAFARLHPEVGSRCEVFEARIAADAARIDFEIRANRFLHNMVRRLTGVLVEVGRGRLQPADVGEILATRDIQRGGPCLPPHGLFLLEVGYADPAGVDGAASPP